ncbi:MAG: META domain-containing protein [Methanocorpusculum sp.]|nr:META domain-containing protein [Methanocorpusculum sp.]HJJ73202.1 META domain-containing protein [Methanocorpusculum sp.]
MRKTALVMLAVALVGIVAAAGCISNAANSDTPVGEWIISGTDVTLSLKADGTFAGKGPVNNYFGNYVQNGESLTLEQVGATMMFGPNMEAEDAYFESLKNVAGFTLTDAGLTLVDANGKAVVSFAAQSFVDEE